MSKKNEEFVKSITRVRKLLRQNEQKKVRVSKKIANNAKMPLLIYRISSIIYSSCTKSVGIVSLFSNCIYKKTTKNTGKFDILLTRKGNTFYERLAVYSEESFTA